MPFATSYMNPVKPVLADLPRHSQSKMCFRPTSSHNVKVTVVFILNQGIMQRARHPIPHPTHKLNVFTTELFSKPLPLDLPHMPTAP